jgi:Flp pilus assembly pilin Flp
VAFPRLLAGIKSEGEVHFMRTAINLARRFFRQEDGQDTMEYTLLLGFVALAAAAIFPVVTANIKTIWQVASNHLSNAASAAK